MIESSIIEQQLRGGRSSGIASQRRCADNMSIGANRLKIGVLAYGSLIDDPGPDLGPYIASTLKNIKTPFPVEYARSSLSRGGGPSLIPVGAGGANVAAVIHVLKDGVSVEQAKDWLWRREVRRYGPKDHYVPNPRPGKNTVVVDSLFNFGGLETVLYTRISANISPLNADRLAHLAVESAQTKTVKAGKDGISYLLNAKKHGIITPLTDGYERAVLRLTGSPDLPSALHCARGMGSGPTVADRAAVVRTFCEDCVWARAIRTHFAQLFETGERRGELLREAANTFFHDLNIVLLEYVLLQQYKLVDDSSAGAGKVNLTSNYLLSLDWSDETRARLQTENESLLVFRSKIADARRKLIAHTDLRARLDVISLGSFVQADELAFWSALQRFVNAAHDEAVGGPLEIDASMPDGDAASLIHRLADAVDYADLVAEDQVIFTRRVGRRRFDGV